MYLALEEGSSGIYFVDISNKLNEYFLMCLVIYYYYYYFKVNSVCHCDQKKKKQTVYDNQLKQKSYFNFLLN